MTTITVTKDQLNVIQNALDFWSRVGIGDFREIVDHPTFEKSLYKICSPNKELEVGDKTLRGEIAEMGEDYIKTKGSWGKGEEIKTWEDIENIKHSPDWNKLHKLKDDIEDKLTEARNMLYGDTTRSKNGSWGIYNPNVDESCRVAFDILQVIRFEKNRTSDNPSTYTVDAYKHLSTKDSEKIKVEI